jgi:1-phosphofructokinase family hexose kinase
MIVCFSANPALDRRLRIGQLVLGEVNRAHSSEILPGGKAAHVAMAARALGERTAWVAFLGGPIGEQCATEMRQLDIEVVPARTRAPTRVNLEVIDNSGQITELLEPGGTPDADEREAMLRICQKQLRGEWKNALVAISGSLPVGTPAKFYLSLIETAHSAGSKVFLDTSGDALQASLETNPDFLKPNHKEAEVLLGRSVNTLAEARDAAAIIMARGARSVAVTLGAEGLVWRESREGPTWAAHPPRLPAVSTVGCGDVTLAGFAYASERGWPGEKAVRFATACGAANCLAKLEGQINLRDVESLLPQTSVRQL